MFLRRHPFWIGMAMAVLALYISPLLLYGQSLPFRIHDHLDITVPMLKILAESGMVFSPSAQIVPNMMGGLPRLVYGSEFNYLVWLFYCFDPFKALVINEIAIHTMAYGAMALLLNYLFRNEAFGYKLPVIHVVSVAFALIPFFPATGMGVALLPLTAYLLLRIREGGLHGWGWLALLLIPFFGNFVLIYFFFLACVGAAIAVDTVRSKKLHLPTLVAWGALLGIFLAVEYRLVYSLLSPDFVSHRSEFVRRSLEAGEVYRGIHNLFLWGQAHSLSLHFPYLLVLIHVALLLLWLKKPLTPLGGILFVAAFAALFAGGGWEWLLTWKYYLPLFILFLGWNTFRNREGALLHGLLAFALVASTWYGLWYSRWWWEMTEGLGWLRMIDLSRFALLLPPLWYVAGAIATLILIRSLRYGWMVAVMVWGMQIYMALVSTHFSPDPQGISYRAFYDTRTFSEVKRYIGKDSATYRVCSVGIHPGVSLYNGFYTLDGYAPNYPLSYKHRFRELIRENFIHYPNTRDFFDKWGSKCYVVGPFDYDAYERGAKLGKLYLDTGGFREMGGRYLLSGYEITDTGTWRLQKRFVSPDGYWDIYLYEAISNTPKKTESLKK